MQPHEAHTTKPGVIDDEEFSLADFLKTYGYLLNPRRDPNCHLWLKGTIADSYLDHARRVIWQAHGLTP